ncbi:hypothetical protein RJT34_24137 [Clitoria ternatea]|uniref:Uncharacterized protein n=1 Tax=Clitoria ternatea TaxID=43366 RepID=A0AAN9FVV3_CLITE
MLGFSLGAWLMVHLVRAYLRWSGRRHTSFLESLLANQLSQHRAMLVGRSYVGFWSLHMHTTHIAMYLRQAGACTKGSFVGADLNGTSSGIDLGTRCRLFLDGVPDLVVIGMAYSTGSKV